MRTKAEIYKALVEGKTLEYKDYAQLDHMVKLSEEGNLVYVESNAPANVTFSKPENWSIVEPKVEITLKDLAAAMGRSAYSPLFFITARRLKLTTQKHANEKYIKGVYHDEES